MEVGVALQYVPGSLDVDSGYLYLVLRSKYIKVKSALKVRFWCISGTATMTLSIPS